MQDIRFFEDMESFVEQDATTESIAFVHCTAGRLQVQAEGQTYELRQGDLLLCPWRVIHNNYMQTPDFRCTVTILRKQAFDEIVHLCRREDRKWWEKAQYMQRHPIIHMTERQKELARAYTIIMRVYANDEEKKETDHIRQNIAQAVILELLIWLEEAIEKDEKNAHRTRREVLFSEFMRLLQQTNGKQREVRWFAKQLSVTPKYLTAVCIGINHQSASQIINDVTTQEIKRLLRHTDLSVKEICARLHFSRLSFFCKYVKQQFGVSATEYRSR